METCDYEYQQLTYNHCLHVNKMYVTSPVFMLHTEPKLAHSFEFLSIYCPQSNRAYVSLLLAWTLVEQECAAIIVL